MTTVKEISIASIGEPYSVKIERGMKGQYGYEISVKSDNAEDCVEEIFHMKQRIEDELYGGEKDAQQTA